MIENFPDPPAREKQVTTTPILPPRLALDSKKLRAMSFVSETGLEGKLDPQILYLLDFDMELEQIKVITGRFPSFSYYNLEGKIKPVVEFFLDLGIPKSDTPIILCERPQPCGISLAENLKPTMTFLENLGVDKKQWMKIVCRFPPLLTYSRQKLTATVDFLTKMGLSEENIGKILTRSPNIISYSVEDKLWHTAEYFRSLGVDVAVFLHRCPYTFGLSIKANLKPITEFFLDKGYSFDEIRTMISRYGALYTFNLYENLEPKWEYFLTMDYPKSELVKFPRYFGYSLKERIKPRYEVVKECGVKLLLKQIVSLSGHEFDKSIQEENEENAFSSGSK